MKLAYLALASTLVSCMLYTMDTVDKKKRKKAIPATILIEQTVNKIPFKGKTKKLSEWIRQDGNRTFGKTRLFTLSKYGKLKQTATIKDIELAQIEDGLKIRSCVYVTNLEKVLLKNNRHLYLGALIMYKGN
ncbi:MAG TPA: hypothetical protein VJ201_08260, partial [Candidatus Babeliales bacterium]|nr:hypothetical protein [Candidatus Babeliales bacterium]